MVTKKVLVVDDELLARQRIGRFLKEFKEIEFEISEATNGPEAIRQILQIQPDLLFLDVQLPGMDGFEVLRNMENRNFKIIFQTAFDEFALKAFEENAIDYLLKPFTQERFDKALKKVLRTIDQEITLSGLAESLALKGRYLENLTVRQGNALHIIKVDEITHFVSQNHYTSAFTEKGEHLLDQSLSFLATQLDPSRFVQTHRSCIVSLKSITTIGGFNDSQVELFNGTILPLARSKREKILNYFRPK